MKKILFNPAGSALVRREIIDAATGTVVKSTGWTRNLIFDAGLNAIAAGGVGFAGVFATCKIGSNNSGNAIASGSVTFTQATNIVTASASFFTSDMIGSILKYGTGSGGAEVYITGYTNAVTVTVGTSMTVASPTVGTVWLVAQTALQAFEYLSNTYDTSAGSNFTSFSGNVVTLQRTYLFPVQGTTYTVGEIGYDTYSTSGGSVVGRVALSSPDTITTSQYYRVQILFTWTQSPGSPTSVGNVGTGANTAGTVMVQVWDCSQVNSSGNAIAPTWNPSCGFLDVSYFSRPANGVVMAFHTANDVTLNSSIQNSAPAAPAEAYAAVFSSPTNSGQPVGVSLCTATFNLTTAGESVYAFTFGNRDGSNHVGQSYAQTLTTPIGLPTGVYTGSLTFTWQFSRTLTN